MDTIADMLIAIKNGYMAKKPEIVMPYSKFKLAIANVLEKKNYVGKVKKNDSTLTLSLLYTNNRAKLTQISKVSTQGRRIYIKNNQIKTIKGGRGILIISTPQGVMTGEEAKAKKLGGELICQVW